MAEFATLVTGSWCGPREWYQCGRLFCLVQALVVGKQRLCPLIMPRRRPLRGGVPLSLSLGDLPLRRTFCFFDPSLVFGVFGEVVLNILFYEGPTGLGAIGKLDELLPAGEKLAFFVVGRSPTFAPIREGRATPNYVLCA